ncbi:MAG: transposase [Candidatus Fermentibacteraceae bacterium]|nr:transposase [Candidatus Fermentibacteraceae bacterium]
MAGPQQIISRDCKNLGISKELLYRWRKEYRLREELAFPGHGREALTPDQFRKYPL